MHYKLVLTFESADEIRKASLKCHHTNESYRAVLSSVHHAVLFIIVYAVNPTLFHLLFLSGFMQFRPVPGIGV